MIVILTRTYVYCLNKLKNNKIQYDKKNNLCGYLLLIYKKNVKW